MDIPFFCINFAHINKRKDCIMLGMVQNGMSVKGSFARKIRMQLWRIATGNRNEEDQLMSSLHDDVLKNNQYKITWNI